MFMLSSCGEKGGFLMLLEPTQKCFSDLKKKNYSIHRSNAKYLVAFDISFVSELFNEGMTDIKSPRDFNVPFKHEILRIIYIARFHCKFRKFTIQSINQLGNITQQSVINFVLFTFYLHPKQQLQSQPLANGKAVYEYDWSTPV